jgi:O-antigen/teichoic acid export membrane protein
MDPYTIGRLALPVVIGIMAVAAILTMAMGIFTAVKTMASVQRFFHLMERNERSKVTINIFAGKRSSKPPMQARK